MAADLVACVSDHPILPDSNLLDQRPRPVERLLRLLLSYPIVTLHNPRQRAFVHNTAVHLMLESGIKVIQDMLVGLPAKSVSVKLTPLAEELLGGDVARLGVMGPFGGLRFLVLGELGGGLEHELRLLVVLYFG